MSVCASRVSRVNCGDSPERVETVACAYLSMRGNETSFNVRSDELLVLVLVGVGAYATAFNLKLYLDFFFSPLLPFLFPSPPTTILPSLSLQYQPVLPVIPLISSGQIPQILYTVHTTWCAH